MCLVCLVLVTRVVARGLGPSVFVANHPVEVASKNCKRMVYHDDDKCMELEKNAHPRYDGWKSCLE